jgi:uncharacterized damage-inducible protein DinB
MIERTPWFERILDGSPEAGAYASVIERLRGTPARIAARVRGLVPVQLTRRLDDDWSIQENVGHLGDLEPLWAGRVDDLLAGRAELRPADLENRATHAAGHNERPFAEVLGGFERARSALVARLERLSAEQVARTARHPRLQRPMSTLELCLFVAEHDDHHLATISAILGGSS